MGDGSRRLRRLVIGSQFLPMVFGAGLKTYRVTRDPLPDDAAVVSVRMESPWQFEITLESAAFDLVEHGGVVPPIEPVFEAARTPAQMLEWITLPGRN